MAEVRTIEAFYRGEDGGGRSASRRIAELLDDARTEGIGEVLIELRAQPDGLSTGDRLFVKYLRTDQPVEAIVTALQQQTEERLDPTFVGQLRINMRSRADNAHLGSYSVQFRPESMAAVQTAVATGQIPLSAFDVNAIPTAVRPFFDMSLRLMQTGADMMRAGAEIVKSTHAPAQPVSASAGVELIRALNNMGQAAGQGTGATSPTPPAPVVTYSAPASVPMQQAPLPLQLPGPVKAEASTPTTTGAATVTEADVIAWADANPERVRQLVLSRIGGGS